MSEIIVKEGYFKGLIKSWKACFKGMFNLDYHYSVVRRDYQYRFAITEFLHKSLSIAVISVYRFFKDKCIVTASALTYYSILAVVPVLALMFAIAKGFGADDIIQGEIATQLHGNEDLTRIIVNYANQAIENAKSGIITGFGIVLLLWAVIRVLSNTENAMNTIWRVKKGRNLKRMFTDYFSVIFIAPILIILGSSINVYLSSNLENYFPIFGTYFIEILKILPYLIIWILFVFIYMFMPVAPVKFKHALVSGIVAGTLFQLVQFVYLRFQIGVSSYNAIYGSLAALPLLLVWLQLSWCIVLWGCELCFILRNRHFMYNGELLNDLGWMETIESSLKIMRYVAYEHVNGNGGPSLEMINEALKINTSKLRIVLSELVDFHLLIETREDDDYYYYPALDLHTMTVADVIIRMSRVSESRNRIWTKQFIEAVEGKFGKDTLI